MPRATPAVVICCRPDASVTASGDAEVHHHRVPAGEHDVLRLDVAVNHTCPVRDGERLGDLAQEPHGLVHRNSPERAIRSRSVSPSTYGIT